MAGLPKKYAKMGFKKGWAAYKASRKSSSSKSKSKSKTSDKGGNRTVSKGGFNTQKIFKYLRLGSLALPGAGVAMSNDPAPTKIWRITKMYTGYDSATRKWSLGNMAEGYLPFLGTTLVTYGIPKIAGMLRRL